MTKPVKLSETKPPRILAGALIVAAVMLSYLPVFTAGYIVDDDTYVAANLALRDFDGLKRIWTDLSATPQYYPLVFTSFWVEYQIWGARPAGYHIDNVLLHACNALLVWLLLQSLGIQGAWLVAALFALHPVQVESVAWVAERKNVLSTAFYLLSLLAFFRWRLLGREGEDPPDGVGAYLMSLTLFLLAMLSKTATVTLPAVILLLVWWKEARIRARDWAAVAPMLGVGLVLSLLTIKLESAKGAGAIGIWDLSIMDRILIAGRAVWFYAAKLAWPVSLSFDYGRWSTDAGAWWHYLYPVGVIVVIGVLWSRRSRIGRGPLVGVLFFIGTLAPTLGFIDVYFFRYSFVADHFQYIACLGLLTLAAAWGVGRVAKASIQRTRAAAASTGILLALLGGLTFQRAQAFESLETLCLDTLSKNPMSWLANNNLGNIYMQRGDLEKAQAYFEAAQEIAPTYVETPLNLAILKMNLEHYDEAMGHAARAIEIGPGYPYGYQHMGDALQRSGRVGESIGWYRQALARDAESTRAMVGLGSALAKTGQVDEAITLLTTVVERDPHNVVALTNLGIAFASAGDLEGAIQQLEAALRLDPSNGSVARNLELAKERMSKAEATKSVQE